MQTQIQDPRGTYWFPWQNMSSSTWPVGCTSGQLLGHSHSPLGTKQSIRVNSIAFANHDPQEVRMWSGYLVTLSNMALEQSITFVEFTIEKDG